MHDAAVAAVRDALDAGVAAVARVEQDAWQVLAVEPADEGPAVEEALADGAAARALVRRAETWLSAPGDDPSRPHPALVAPVVVNGDLWGLLCVVRDERSATFTPDDAARGEVLGALVGAHVARLDLAEQVRHLVSDDALTGLSTRRVADEAAQAAIDSGEETCIVMCDVNGLKKVNDELGHDAGDELLRSVAGVLRRVSSSLPGSTAARIGGDEFCVVVQGVPRTTVVEVMDTTVGDSALPHGASLSYGVASSARGSLGAAPTPRSLFRRADAAQYHAKRSHAAARARQYRADDPGAVLGRTVSATVTALAASGAAPLSRLCALGAAASEAMGGSGWVVARDVPVPPAADLDGATSTPVTEPVVVARGGTSSLHVSGVRHVDLRRAPWTVTLETTLPADDAAAATTLQTLVALAVLGSA
ncbi:sensor domain-containing diguanylate cyclase [Cellulomonas triticagri]|uniref:Sensor domain-containing diguanylate cyclase n=1 Tax=Cellulomonas triticagri TaxID=2483352 RepID=A0A3M2J3K5_9CELL|nr:sensor domain-containing diguanylate cyclase [Cellulomonas triticagri]